MITSPTPNCHSIGDCNLQSLRALVAPLFILGSSISYLITSQFFEARIQLIDFISKKTKDTGFFHRRLLGLAEKTSLSPPSGGAHVKGGLLKIFWSFGREMMSKTIEQIQEQIKAIKTQMEKPDLVRPVFGTLSEFQKDNDGWQNLFQYWRFTGASFAPKFIKLGKRVYYRKQDLEQWLAAKPSFTSASQAKQFSTG